MCMGPQSCWGSRSMQPSILATAAAPPSTTGANALELPSNHLRFATLPGHAIQKADQGGDHHLGSA